jgi:hypothetical protein
MCDFSNWLCKCYTSWDSIFDFSNCLCKRYTGDFICVISHIVCEYVTLLEIPFLIFQIVYANVTLLEIPFLIYQTIYVNLRFYVCDFSNYLCDECYTSWDSIFDFSNCLCKCYTWDSICVISQIVYVGVTLEILYVWFLKLFM